MVVKYEGRHAGHFIVSEANKTRSRERVTIAEGEVLEAGTVLALHTTSGEYLQYQNDETSVSNAAKAILFDNVDATDGPVDAIAIVRDAEVNGGELIWADTEDTGDRDAAIADLKAVGIIVLDGDEPVGFEA